MTSNRGWGPIRTGSRGGFLYVATCANPGKPSSVLVQKPGQGFRLRAAPGHTLTHILIHTLKPTHVHTYTHTHTHTHTQGREGDDNRETPPLSLDGSGRGVPKYYNNYIIDSHVKNPSFKALIPWLCHQHHHNTTEGGSSCLVDL